MHYLLYGLCVQSEIPLPLTNSLEPSTPPDVRILYTPINVNVDDFADPGPTVGLYEYSTESVTLYHPMLGVVQVRNGSQILVNRDDREETRLHSLLQGPAMAHILQQRGFGVLHATTIMIENRIICLVAPKGHGKSTTAAAATLIHNADLICDDITPISFDENNQPIVTARGQNNTLRLWPDTLEYLGIDPTQLAQVHPDISKRYLRLPHHQHQAQEEFRLDAIVVLKHNPVLEMQLLSPDLAIITLLPHGYMAIWSDIYGKSPTYFKQIATIASSVSVYTLGRPADYELLNRSIEVIYETILN